MKFDLTACLSTALLSLCLFCPLAHGAVVVFTDPTVADGDHISSVGDITSATVTFNAGTGAYNVDWTATAINPFSGNMRLNLNLGNAAVGPGVVSLFGQFNLGAPTTHLSYGGINAGLMGWNIGDEIFTSGGPPTFATTFISGNANLDSISVLPRWAWRCAS